MGKQFIDVEVTVTSTVVYRLPRPTKAEVVEEMGGSECWDKDDPEGSIQEHLESQDIDDLIQGHRPVSVVVDDKEIEAVYPSEKGSRPLEARPMVKIKCNIQMDDGSLVEAWWCWDTWRRVGDETYGGANGFGPLTPERCANMATKMTRIQAKRLVDARLANGAWTKWVKDVEYVPVQSN